MQIIKTIMISIALLLAPGYALAADLDFMRISLIEGDVQIKTPEAGDWGPASINGPVGEGDQLWIPGGGRVELQLDSGTYIRLDQDSALQVLALDRDSSQFYLSQGHAYIYYNATKGNEIQFDTPDASTRAYNTAVFKVDMSDRYTDVTVYKGYVETENSIGTTRINANEVISLGKDTNGEVSPIGPPDSWERWNKERNDRMLGRRDMSSRYLPDELRGYSADFDDNGKWVNVPDYGNVWTPTVIVFQDWAPYRHGRWIWRGGDYVWVGYERWGWAPYHYGRWAFARGYGWCWVPPARGEVYWGPGYVGWVRTGDYVAWVPLAPRETYYGRGHYGPHSVNITNINITQVNVTNVYKNVNVNNSVTVINRNSFNTASPTRANVHQDIIRKNIFVKNNFSVVGPNIKPTRASYFGSAKPVPAAKLPPQHVKEQSVRALKEARPFVRESDKSVMRRGARTEALPVIKDTTPRTPGKGRPALQQVRPEERGKPVAPAPKPEQKIERREIKPPVERGKSEVREAAPPAKIERREVQPPVERRRPIAPEPKPEPKIEKREIKPPVEKKPEVREAAPESKDEKKPSEHIEGPQGEQKRQRFEERGR